MCIFRCKLPSKAVRLLAGLDVKHKGRTAPSPGWSAPDTSKHGRNWTTPNNRQGVQAFYTMKTKAESQGHASAHLCCSDPVCYVRHEGVVARCLLWPRAVRSRSATNSMYCVMRSCQGPRLYAWLLHASEHLL